MALEETLLKLEELRKSTSNEPLKIKITKMQNAYLDIMVNNDGLKID